MCFYSYDAIFETFELFSWFLLPDAECVMSYLSIFEVEVDYKLSFLVKQQLVAFLIWNINSSIKFDRMTLG